MAKLTPHKLTSLSLNELSLVDNPANKGARVTIFKRGGDGLRDAILKCGLCSVAGEDARARSFGEVLEAAEAQRRQWEANEELWPLFEALTTSIRSVAGDKGLDVAAKLTRVQESVDQFVTALRAKWPDVEQELAKLLKADPALAGLFVAGDASGDHTAKGDIDMADKEDAVADLKKQVADLTKKVEKAEAAKAEAEKLAKLNDAERAHLATLSKAEDKAAFLDMAPAQRKKELKKAGEDDEVIKVEGHEIRKSAVGEAQFAIIKSQQTRLDKQADDIKKANERAELADLRKRADDEYGHLPGSVDERAVMLKAIGGLDEAVRKTVESALGQAEKLAKAGFDRIGHRGGEVDVTKADAIRKFDKHVSEIQARDKCSKMAAMEKARTEHPADFEAYQEAGAVEVN